MLAELRTPQDPQLKPMSLNFSWMQHCVLRKSKSAIPPLFNSPEVLSSASDKAKLFPKNFSKNSNLDDSGISLPVSPSTTTNKIFEFSCEIAHYGKSSIYIFKESFASIDKIFFLGEHWELGFNSMKF